MEYTVRVWSAEHGDVVPLIYVAQAMARAAASGGGTRPVHHPTLAEVKPRYIAMLLDAANRGHLTVCDQIGGIACVKELTDAAEVAADADAMGTLIHLYTKAHSLQEWGQSKGDVFHFAETPGQVVVSDLKDFTGGFDSDAKVLEAGYYRGTVGGGESEPWSDSVTDAAKSDAAFVSTSNGIAKNRTPEPKQLLQEKRILELIVEAGHDALKLPRLEPGKKGVKSTIKVQALAERRLFSASSFDKAWQRIRDDGKLAEVSE